MTWSQQQIVNSLLVGGFLVVAAVAFSAGWSWLAGILIAWSVMIIAPKPLS
jgi:hypothetical protein